MKNPNKVCFQELLLWTNKSILEVSILCGKSERTIKDYIKTNKPCKACQTLLMWLYFSIPHWRAEIKAEHNKKKIKEMKYYH